MKNLKAYLLLLPALLFCSCSDFLDKDPEVTIDAETVDYTDLNNMYQPVSGVYSWLRQEGTHWAVYAMTISRDDDVDPGTNGDDWVKLNKHGKRFMNECIPGQQLENQIELQPGQTSFQIYDSKWPEQIPYMPANHGGLCYIIPEDEDESKSIRQNKQLLQRRNGKRLNNKQRWRLWLQQRHD